MIRNGNGWLAMVIGGWLWGDLKTSNELEIEKGRGWGAISSRSFDILNSMIY